jgi:2-succinyl-5-enolpyruvyl-6-hydroxy-3-cyclohexene-1-carboxylate synthase
MTGMNPSTVLATVLVDALVRLGVRHAVLCPGSRSSALAYALVAVDGDRPQLHVRVDERSAGFLALGLAKRTGVPAVVVTTSGTAVANLYPAVLEAAHAGVPLIVLSADRPHRLRGTGANQTTDQVKLFGPAVRLFTEIPAPSTAGAEDAAGWRSVVSRVVAASLGRPGGGPGPVQLNVAFSEPLVPDDEGGNPSWTREATGLTLVDAPVPRPVPLPDAPGTVVLAGDGAGPDAARLAVTRGWPLLAEPSSGSRVVPAVGPYRLLLDLPGVGREIRRVIVFGRPTLSRPVSHLLARPGVEVVVVSARPVWPDPASRASRVLPAVEMDVAAADRVLTQPETAVRNEWSRIWQEAGRTATDAVDAVLDEEIRGGGGFSGALVARMVQAAAVPGQALVVGPSSAIRDLDLAGAPRPFAEGLTVLSNRGLSGIDGVVSTAAGVSLAARADGDPLPVRVLVGDLTFLHDINALLIGPAERRPRLQIVVVDDGGGGIFRLLEPGALAERDAAAAGVFDRVFRTPTGVELASLCSGYGVGFRDVSGAGSGSRQVTALAETMAEPGPGIEVVRIPVDRVGARDLDARVEAAVRAAVPRPGATGRAAGSRG